MANFPRRPAMRGIPGSVSWILCAILAVILIPFADLPTAHAPTRAPAFAPPTPPKPQVEITIATEGSDRHHRRLPFTIYVLSQELSWKLESVSKLEGRQTLLDPELTAALNRAQDVFCVGTASFEGATPVEEARAARRAASLAHWVLSAIPSSPVVRLHCLNAGQYQGPPELASSSQRKAILILAQGHDEGVNLGEALRSGLEKRQRQYPIVSSLLHEYSRSADWLRRLQ